MIRLPPGTKAAQAWVLALTSVASLMVALDALVVSTALAAIRVHLPATSAPAAAAAGPASRQRTEAAAAGPCDLAGTHDVRATETPPQMSIHPHHPVRGGI